jgi:hypothetical protein
VPGCFLTRELHSLFFDKVLGLHRIGTLKTAFGDAPFCPFVVSLSCHISKTQVDNPRTKKVKKVGESAGNRHHVEPGWALSRRSRDDHANTNGNARFLLYFGKHAPAFSADKPHFFLQMISGICIAVVVAMQVHPPSP